MRERILDTVLLLEPDELARRRGDVRGRESGELPQPTLGRLLEDTIRDREHPSRHTAHPGS